MLRQPTNWTGLLAYFIQSKVKVNLKWKYTGLLTLIKHFYLSVSVICQLTAGCKIPGHTSLHILYLKVKGVARLRWTDNLAEICGYSDLIECTRAATFALQLDQIGTILGLFKISFSTFGLDEPKCTETDLKNFLICPIWGKSGSLWA